jgi:hypothetical protein
MWRPQRGTKMSKWQLYIMLAAMSMLPKRDDGQ